MHSHRWTPLIVGAAAGITCGVLAFHASSYFAKQISKHRKTTPLSLEGAAVSRPVLGVSSFLDDEVLSEQFTRNVQFFGEEGQLRVAKSFVVVIGLGVGSLPARKP